MKFVFFLLKRKCVLSYLRPMFARPKGNTIITREREVLHSLSIPCFGISRSSPSLTINPLASYSPGRTSVCITRTHRGRWEPSPTLWDVLVEASCSEHALFNTAEYVHSNLTSHLVSGEVFNDCFTIRRTISSSWQANKCEQGRGHFVSSSQINYWLDLVTRMSIISHTTNYRIHNFVQSRVIHAYKRGVQINAMQALKITSLS